MKKYLPFVITGIISASAALGLFTIVNKPIVLPDIKEPLTLFTNHSPFDYTQAFASHPERLIL